MASYNRVDGQFVDRYRRDKRNRHNLNNPHLRLRNYEGPYDHQALTRARDELCCYVERMQNSAAWYNIKRKTDVNVYEFRDFDDGFGEASNAFSHAGLPENQTDSETYQDRNEQFSADPPFGLPENSTELKTQGPSATVANNNSEVDLINIERESVEEHSSSSDCIIVDEVLKSTGNYNLDSDGFEIVPATASSEKVVVIEDDSFDNSTVETHQKMESLGTDIGSGDVNMNMEMNSAEMERTVTFKCDVCDYVSDAKTDMQEHLNKAVHLAASEYTLERKKLKRPMVLTNFKAKFKEVLVICPAPSCFKIFPHIHMCVNHYNLQHVRNKNERNKYGLINIVKEEDCINAVNPKQCHICFKHFGSRTYMNRHFQDYKHYPYTEVIGCKKIFFCFYCKSNFDTFESITSHQEMAHKKDIKKGTLQFTVFHYKNIKTHRLLLGEEIASTSYSDTTRMVESGSELGTNKRNPNESNTESGSTVGTSKRKHDGNSKDMEPRIKITVNNEYATRYSDKNQNSIHVVNEGSVKNESSLPETSFTMSKDIGDNIDKTTNKGNLTETFKCDYCLKTARDKNQMYLHLIQDVHSSASTVLIDQQENIVYLKETTTVLFEGAYYKKVAATCQENHCRLLFDTIFMCDDHNANSHQCKDRRYYLVDIVNRIPVKVAVSENVCSTCGQSFRRSKQLNNHYTQSDHFPFKDRSDCNIFTLCCYCNRTFSSYKVASGHVKGHQNFAKNGLLDLVILYVSKDPRKYTLPPYQLSKNAERTSIRSKISNLQHMRKMCGKLGKSEIRKEIRELKHLL